MEEPCFCTLDDILTCLVDKTKVSLPVLITACALGYIWVARRKINDMKKQCDVLEDDMRHIKRENFQIVEEIRHLKCAVSDTQLVTNSPDRCRTDRSRAKTNQCYNLGRHVDKSCSEGDGCISRRKRERRSRNRSSSCVNEGSHFTSYSTPDVYPKGFTETPPKKSSQGYSNHRTSRFEFCPGVESTPTKRFKKGFDCNDCPSNSYLNSEKHSTYDSLHFEPKIKRTKLSNGNCKKKLAKTHCPKHSCHSPKPLKEPNDCFRFFEEAKKSNSLDMCQPELRANKCKQRKQKRRQSPEIKCTDCPYESGKSFIPKSNYPNLRSKSPKGLCFEDIKPLSSCESRSFQLKQKIDKFKNELAADINSTFNSVNRLPSQIDTPFDKKFCEFKSREERCKSRC